MLGLVPMLTNLGNHMNDLADNVFMWGLVIAAIFDFLTGVAKAVIWKVASSSVGLKGATKHGLVLLAFFIVYPFAGLFDVIPMVNIVATIYLGTYVLSILENFGAMGIFVPSFLESKIRDEVDRYQEQLKNKDKNKEG